MNHDIESLHNEIDRLTEYEDRAEKAEEALRKILNHLELGNEKTYNRANEILESVGCFPFAGMKVRK